MSTFGTVLSRKDGKVFFHKGEEWKVYFEEYESGFMPVVSRKFDSRPISLLLTEQDIALTMRKLNDLDERLDTIPFRLFKDIVGGAAMLSMKYG
jgi:hypothetical protein